MFHDVLDARQKGEPDPELADPDPYDLATAAAMVQVHAEVQPPLEIVASELPFTLPLVNRQTGCGTPVWAWAGVIDGIARLDSGALALVERKTTSRDITPGNDYWVQVMRDQQISLYVMAARAAGWDIRTVLYDVVKRPMHRPKMATPEEERTYRKPDVKFGKIEKIPAETLALGYRRFTIEVNGEMAGAAFSVGKDEWKVGALTMGGISFAVSTGYGTLATAAKKGIKDRIAELVTGPLHAHCRERDETPEEYAARLADLMREDTPSWLQRIEIPRLQSELDATADDQWALQRMIRRSQRRSEWPRNPASCFTPYRCGFVDVCDNHDLETRTPEGFVRREDLHPEVTRAYSSD